MSRCVEKEMEKRVTLAEQGWVSAPGRAFFWIASVFCSVMGSLPLSKQGKRQTPIPRFGLRVQAQSRPSHALHLAAW